MTQYTLLWFSRKLLAYTFFKTECGSEVKKFHVSIVPTESRVLFSILRSMIVILLGWISTSKKFRWTPLTLICGFFSWKHSLSWIRFWTEIQNWIRLLIVGKPGLCRNAIDQLQTASGSLSAIWRYLTKLPLRGEIMKMHLCALCHSCKTSFVEKVCFDIKETWCIRGTQ